MSFHVVSADQIPTNVVLDPAAVADDRVELDLNYGPIRVVFEGIDWGEAEIAAYMAQAARGEVPVDFRVPNRKITIPLQIVGDDATDFREARSQLQAKTALLQREGGWLQRGPYLYADIVNATLKLPDKWGYKSFEVDIVLTLEALPDFYSDEEELDLITETTATEIAAVLEQDGEPAIIEGDYPGRVRIVVNENDGEDQLGLVWAIRSRYYDDATTALLAYEAEALTPLDAAAIATVSGASGGGSNNVVRHTNLSTSWTPVLSTDLLAGTSLTHRGSYRVRVRAYSTSGDDVQLRLLWDVGDLALPVENAPQRLPATASQFYALDLGEVRLDEIPVGDHRWQGVIQAKGDAGGENVSIDKVWIEPVDDGHGVLRAPATAEQGLADFVARDEFNQSAGALTGKTAPVGGAWVGVGDSDDFAVDGSGLLQRTNLSDSGIIGRVDTLNVNLAATLVQVDFKRSALDAGMRSGAVARYVDASNMVAVEADGVDGVAILKLEAGIYSNLGGGVEMQFSPEVWYTLRLLVDVTGRCACWVFPRGGVPGAPVLTASDSQLAAGGSLASGDVGVKDQHGATACTRSYDNFATWVPTTDAVLHASQSAELRTDGMVREDSAGAAYGPVSHVIGDLPRLPPSGMEERPVEVFLKASRGDLDQLPDVGIDDLSARVYYRPSWLFAAA